MRDKEGFAEDVMTIAKNIFGNVVGARTELKAQATHYVEQMARNLDLVGREEFDVAFAMLSKIRSNQEDILERLQTLEGGLGQAGKKHAKKSPARRLPFVKKGKQKIK